MNEAYGRMNIPLGLTYNFGDFDDVPASVAQKIHTLSGSQKVWAQLDDDTRKRKISKTKTHLNELAASLMTMQRLEQVDSGGDIINWFSQMKQLANV